MERLQPRELEKTDRSIDGDISDDTAWESVVIRPIDTDIKVDDARESQLIEGYVLVIGVAISEAKT